MLPVGLMWWTFFLIDAPYFPSLAAGVLFCFVLFVFCGCYCMILEGKSGLSLNSPKPPSTVLGPWCVLSKCVACLGFGLGWGECVPERGGRVATDPDTLFLAAPLHSGRAASRLRLGSQTQGKQSHVNSHLILLFFHPFWGLPLQGRALWLVGTRSSCIS